MFSRPLLHQREGSVRRLKCVIAKLGERCRHGMRRFLSWRGHQVEGAAAVGQGGTSTQARVIQLFRAKQEEPRRLGRGHVSAEQGGKTGIKNDFLLCHRPFNGSDKARQFTHQLQCLPNRQVIAL